MVEPTPWDRNQIITLPRLAVLAGSPYIVAFTDNSITNTMNERVLLDLGADVTIDIRDSSAVTRAIAYAECRTEEDHAPVAA